jgi:hypothetical protein
MAELVDTALFADAALKVYYQGEDAVDSKNGWNLTNHDATFAAAKWDNGFHFANNKTDTLQYLSKANIVGLNVASASQLSIVFWMKLDALPETGGQANYRLLANGQTAGGADCGQYMVYLGNTVLGYGIGFGYLNSAGTVNFMANCLHTFALDQWYHIAIVYTYPSGVAATVPSIYINGVSRYVQGWNSIPDGTITADTTNGLYVGADHWSVDHPTDNRGFNGMLDDVGIFIGHCLSQADVLLLQATTGPFASWPPVHRIYAQLSPDVWTDLSGDILAEPGVRWDRGMAGSAPSDRVATPGLMHFVLNNSAGNSGGIQGWYSVGHASCRSGWTYGIPIKLVTECDSAEWPVWYGKVRTIAPTGGRYLAQQVDVTCQDQMGDFGEKTVRSVALQIGTTEDALVRAVVDAMPVSALPVDVSVDISTSTHTIQYAFDRAGPGTAAVGLFQDIAQSMCAWIFASKSGVLTHLLQYTQSLFASKLTLDDSNLPAARADEFEMPNSLEGVYNRVRLTYHNKVLGSADTDVVYAASEVVWVAAGATIEVWGAYADPNNVLDLIGATATQTPTANTDYQAHAQADGGGADYTANVVVAATPFASTVLFTITNNAAATAYFNTVAGAPFLKLRGRTVSDRGELTVESYIAKSYGDRSLDLDLPLESARTIALARAQSLRDGLCAMTNRVDAVPVDPQQSQALMLDCLALEIGDVITVTETMSGLNAATKTLRGIDGEIDAAGVMHLTLRTAPLVPFVQWW